MRGEEPVRRSSEDRPDADHPSRQHQATNYSASRPAWGGVPSYVEIDYRTFRLSLTALPSNEILFDPEYLAKRGK